MPSSHAGLVRALRRHELFIAESVTEAFLARHPDWVARYGDRARTAGVEDARYHVQFLSSAIEHDAPQAFAVYVRWTTRVLESRGIDRTFLFENLLQVQEAAARLVAAPERDVLARFLRLPAEVDPDPSPSAASDSPLALSKSMFVQAALAGDRRAALTVATEALREGNSLQDLYSDVFQDGLRDVGRLWEINAISVAQEHMATAVTQYVMAQVFERIPRPEVSRGLAILTGVPGELHQIGPLMIADMLEASGWAVQFLGSNLPIASVAAAIEDARPDVLGISVTMLFNVQHASRLVETARAIHQPLRIVVGGAAFRAGADWRKTGADAYAADLKEAVALLST